MSRYDQESLCKPRVMVPIMCLVPALRIFLRENLAVWLQSFQLPTCSEGGNIWKILGNTIELPRVH